MNWFRKGSRGQKSKGSRVQGFKDSSGFNTLESSTPAFLTHSIPRTLSSIIDQSNYIEDYLFSVIILT